MTTKEIQERVLCFIQELTAFYGELSEELSENNLRVIVDNSRRNIDLKKTPRKYFAFHAQRRNTSGILKNLI